MPRETCAVEKPRRHRATFRRRILAALAFSAALSLGAPPGQAFEYFDGRLSFHGFLASQVRFLSDNFDLDDGFDLSQWQNILNVEIEGDLAPHGLGPIEILQAYARVEVRYDCVWTRACGLSSGVNVYGNRAEQLPRHKVASARRGRTGQLFNFDRRRYEQLDRFNSPLSFRNLPDTGTHDVLTFDQLPGFVVAFANSKGNNKRFDPFGLSIGDDPGGYYLAQQLEDCKFGVSEQRGGENGIIPRFLGPWTPDCEIRPNAALSRFPNPLNRNDFNPILAGVDRKPDTGDEAIDPNPNVGDGELPVQPYGKGELPFRPAPFLQAFDPPTGNNRLAQGLYYPSRGLVQALNDATDDRVQAGSLSRIDQNFTQTELAFNHGASQQQTGELKEAYLDLEAAEGRLWMRLGKQTIVWGKTELFRNTDQFNPQDFALSSLPNLEESRIALWAVRGTWSFYDIGPLEDVRAELAMNFDEWQGADLGRCGEPYSPDAVCGLTLGYFAHGLVGAGLAGNAQPPNPWDSPRGIEFGGRTEFRYGRFSFQISDFYGYDDFPYIERFTTYERNVDPLTGRPRRFGARGRCITGHEPACLGIPDSNLVDDNGYPIRSFQPSRDEAPILIERGDPSSSPFDTDTRYKQGSLITSEDQLVDVIENHPANLATFAFGCAVTVGIGDRIDPNGDVDGSSAPEKVSRVDPAACGTNIQNSLAGPTPDISTAANGNSAILIGNLDAARVASASGQLPETAELPLVNLNRDFNDRSWFFDPQPYTDGGGTFWSGNFGTMGEHLTVEQEALLGCGPFFQSDCDIDGIDWLNTEGSVLLQSFPGFEGSAGSVDTFDTANSLIAQPGTLGFRGGPVATRAIGGGAAVILPGARGPQDPGYDAGVDGCIRLGDDARCALSNRNRQTGEPEGARPLIHPVIRFPLGDIPGRPETDPATWQTFRTELAAVSFNLLMLVASRSDAEDPENPTISEFDDRPLRGRDPTQIGPYRLTGCSFRRPQMCETVRNFMSGLGTTRRDVRAGGNGSFGRRDFAWHTSGELLLAYDKRNVLGFAMDFTEDFTKTSWGIETTWVSGQQFIDNDQFDGLSNSDTINMTISADRPTFINFINANRTIFFNTQWFFQYITNYKKNFLVNGPINVLATLTAFTGFHQDRLLAFTTFVYDFQSASGAILPSITYRFSENFSTTIGMNFFWGHEQLRDMPVSSLQPINRVGENAYQNSVENGLSAVRNRDEFNFSIRYTF